MGGWQTGRRKDADYKLAQAIKNGADPKDIAKLQAARDAASYEEDLAMGK